MDTSLIEKLIGYLEELSPQAWEILIRQVRLESVEYLVAGIILLIASLLSARKSKELWEYDDLEGSLLGFVSILSMLFSVVCLSGAVTRILNPGFYVIQYILS